MVMIGRRSRIGASLAVVAILLLALVLRLDGIAFGLPSLYDPDEPIFVLTAFKLLRDYSLNPQWFGHPGTTTIYAIALIEALVYGVGHLQGRFPDASALVHAIYNDPTVAFLPARYFILFLGLLTVALTNRLGTKLAGRGAGLIAALFLAVNPVHIRYSQIIRTDMHAAVFIILVMLSGIAIVRTGKTRYYILGGLWLGLALATKWPSLAALMGLLGAAAWRAFREGDRVVMVGQRLLVLGGMTVAALFISSPYLFLDFGQVLADVHGEVRTHHLNATGFGLWGNLAWYVETPLATAFGWLGLGLAVWGGVVGTRRSRAFVAVILPSFFAFIFMISAQALIWERWAVPLLPMVAVAAGIGIQDLWSRARHRLGDRLGLAITGAMLLATIGPVFFTARAQAVERRIDTRGLAIDWLNRHAPPGSTITVEQLLFRMLRSPWEFRYPAGDAGCVDVRSLLDQRIRYSTIANWRGKRTIIDLGTVAPKLIDTCRADYAILQNYDRYLREPTYYPVEIANYSRLLAVGRTVATFRPVEGHVGGPIVRILRFDPPQKAPERVAPRASRSIASISK